MHMAAETHFEFRWFDHATATAAQTEQILRIYEYTFANDFDTVFNASIDGDFATPLQYFSPEVRGAYGVVVKREEGSDVEEIVGTVGIRRVVVPETCYAGIGADQLPSTRATSLEEANVCELKRMILLPVARGRALSKIMLQEMFSRARELGYESMVLGTKKRLHAANYIYETSGGFIDFSNFNNSPRPDRFMIRKL